MFILKDTNSKKSTDQKKKNYKKFGTIFVVVLGLQIMSKMFNK